MKSKRGGFTLVELIVVLVILGIIAAAAVPSISAYIRRADFMSNEESAKTIFLSAQSAMTSMKSSGGLDELCGMISQLEEENGENFSLGSVGRVNIDHSGDSVLEDSDIYYLKKDAGEPDDEYEQLLCDMLEPYLYSADMLKNAVCVEFDPASGSVYSAIYSDRAQSFEYGGTGIGDEYNVNISYRDYDARRSHTLVGLYSSDVADAGAELDTITLYNVSLVNSDELYIHFEMDPDTLSGILADMSYTYTFTVSDKDNADESFITMTFGGGIFNINGIENISTSGELIDNVRVTGGYTDFDGTQKSFGGRYGFYAVKSSSDNKYSSAMSAGGLSEGYEGFNIILDKYDPDAARIFEECLSLYGTSGYLAPYMSAAASTSSITRFGMTAAVLEVNASLNASPYLSKTERGSYYASSYYADTSGALAYDQGCLKGKSENTAAVNNIRNLSNIRYDLTRAESARSQITANYREYTLGASISAIDTDADGEADQGYSNGGRADFTAINRLNGAFKSDGFIISDMNIVCGEDYNIGLFRENTAAITGIRLSNISVSADGCEGTGTLCGTNGSVISEVSVSSSTVCGGDYTGGVVGRDAGADSAYGNIERGYTDISFGSSSEGDGSEISGGSFTGGIVGNIASDCGEVRGCKNNADIIISSAADYIGGITGIAEASLTAEDGEYISCASYGNIIIESGSHSYIGGITGLAQTDKIINAVNNGDIIINSAGCEYIGGIAGYNARGCTISSSVSDTNPLRNTNNGDIYRLSGGEKYPAEDADFVGGVVGFNVGTIGGSEDDKCVSTGAVLSGGSCIGGIAGYNDSEALVAFCESEPKSGGYYFVKDGSEIINLRGELLDGAYVGGIVGLNRGDITECKTTGGTVIGGEYVGGITGINTNGLYGLENNADVIGKRYVGGISGINAGFTDGESPLISDFNQSSYIISGCSNTGVCAAFGISENGRLEGYAGGITGVNTGAIEDCSVSSDSEALGQIPENLRCAADFAGGAAGYNSGSISIGEASVYAVGGSYVGGIAGFNDKNGYIDEFRIKYAYVSGVGSCIGGAVGLNASAEIFSGGTVGFDVRPSAVNGEYFVGGIIGANITNADSDMKMTVNTDADEILGTVSGKGFVGGMIGYSSVTNADAVSETDKIISLFSSDPDSLYDTYVLGGAGKKNSESVPSLIIGDESARSGNFLSVSADVFGGGVIGLCGGASSMTVKNTVNYADISSSSDGISVSNVSLPDKQPFIGGIAGVNSYNSIIDGCENRGTVDAVRGCGGITAVNENKIIGCTQSSELGGDGASYIGGICGFNRGIIEGCTTSGGISAEYCVGGIVGENVGGILNEVTADENTSVASGSGCAGGISGINRGGTISGAVNRASVMSDMGSAAGICAYSDDDAVITESVNYGGITALDGSAGGIAAVSMGGITLCDNRADIFADGLCGGIAAVNGPLGSIKGCRIINDESGNSITCQGTSASGGAAAINYGEIGVYIPDEYIGMGISGNAELFSYTGAVYSQISGAVIKAERYAGGAVGANLTCQDGEGSLYSIKIDDAIIAADSAAEYAYMGGAAGFSCGIIEGGIYPEVTAEINSGTSVGGAVGGICGKNTGTVSGMIFSGAVSGTGQGSDPDTGSSCGVGGIVGVNGGEFSDAFSYTEYEANGEITVTSYISYSASDSCAAISGCTLTAADNGTTAVSGTGEASSNLYARVGGICGVNEGYSSVIDSSLDCGNGFIEITASFGNVGGIAGENNSVINGCSDYGRDADKTAAFDSLAEQYKTMSAASELPKNQSADGVLIAVLGGSGGADDAVGGIVGHNLAYGDIQNIVLGNLEYDSGVYILSESENGAAGGIAGKNESVYGFRNAVNNAAVYNSGAGAAGGIAGIQQTSESDGWMIYKCVNNGYIKSENGNAGGFIGEYKNACGTVQSCINNGYVQSKLCAAGFSAYSHALTSEGSFYDCVNTGTVSAELSAGIALGNGFCMDGCRSYGTAKYACGNSDNVQISNIFLVSADGVGAQNTEYIGEAADNCFCFSAGGGAELKRVYYTSGGNETSRTAAIGDVGGTEMFMWLADDWIGGSLLPKYRIYDGEFQTAGDGGEYESVSADGYLNSGNHSLGAAVYDALDGDFCEFIDRADNQPYMAVYYESESSTAPIFYEVFESGGDIKASERCPESNGGSEFIGWTDGGALDFDSGDDIPEECFSTVFNDGIAVTPHTLKLYAVYSDTGAAAELSASLFDADAVPSDTPAPTAEIRVEYNKGSYTVEWDDFGADMYEIQIVLADSGEVICDMTASESEISYTAERKYAGRTFYVRVRAIGGEWIKSESRILAAAMDSPKLTVEICADGAVVYPNPESEWQDKYADTQWQIIMSTDSGTAVLTRDNPIGSLPLRAFGKAYTLSAFDTSEYSAVGQTADSVGEMPPIPSCELLVSSIEWTDADKPLCTVEFHSAETGNYKIRAELVTAEDLWVCGDTALTENPNDDTYELIPAGTVISYQIADAPSNEDFTAELGDIPAFAAGQTVNLTVRPWSCEVDSQISVMCYHYIEGTREGCYYVKTADEDKNIPYYSGIDSITAAEGILIPMTAPVVYGCALSDGFTGLSYRFEWDVSNLGANPDYLMSRIIGRVIAVPTVPQPPDNLTAEWISLGKNYTEPLIIGFKNSDGSDIDARYEYIMSIYSSEEDARRGENPFADNITGDIPSGELPLDGITSEYAGRFVGIKLRTAADGIASDYSDAYILRLPPMKLDAPILTEETGDQSIRARINGSSEDLISKQTMISWDPIALADRYIISIRCDGSDEYHRITISKNGSEWNLLGGVDGKSVKNADGSVTYTYSTAASGDKHLYKSSQTARDDSIGVFYTFGGEYEYRITSKDNGGGYSENPYNYALRIDSSDGFISLILPDIEISRYSDAPIFSDKRLGHGLIIRENAVTEIEVQAVNTADPDRYTESDTSVIEWK